MREHDEEPFTLDDLLDQDEWNAAFVDALAEGHDVNTAREIANETMDFRRVGPAVYYGAVR